VDQENQDNIDRANDSALANHTEKFPASAVQDEPLVSD
jgi:hypothetical protein